MTFVMKMAGFAAGSATAASLVWAAAGGGASSGTVPGPTRCIQGVCACVTADASLREIEKGESCPAGERLLQLSEAEIEASDGFGDDLDHLPATTPGTLADLERRLAAVETRPLFEVVTAADDPIFRVTRDGAFLYNDSGAPVVALRASADGGWVTVNLRGTGLAVSVGASGTRSGLRISEGGMTRVDSGKQEHGNHALRFPSLGSGVIAGIGESRAGSGALVVGDRAGQARVTMTVAETGGGAIGVYNTASTAVVSLSEGATRGGLLAIGDASGNPVAKMGVQDDRYGIVLTGPADLGPYIPSSGLPGSYLLGCAGGSGCGPKGGQE